MKVQHEGLREGAAGDMLAITMIVDFIPIIFKSFNYKWLTREMNRNLPCELDFRQEAANLQRCVVCLENLTKEGDLVVPSITYTSERVLCMSFEEGVYVNESEKLASMNLRSSDIARLISKTFCEQIFRNGFVHCDPHEANLLVRPHPNKIGKPQIVLLDHGLYRDLGEEFKSHYCRLWRGIIQSDETEIKKECEYLHAGNMYTLLAAMLTMRPWDDIVSKDINKLKSNATKAESQMLKAYAVKYFREVVSLLGNVPSNLLLVFKTNDCLRHLDRSLGVPINTVTIIAETIADIIFFEDISRANGNLWKIYEAIVSYSHMMLRVIGMKFIAIFIEFFNFF